MKDIVFISHANPEDNDFAWWLAAQLMNAGYKVWCDLENLIGGEDFWCELEMRKLFLIKNGDTMFLYHCLPRKLSNVRGNHLRSKGFYAC